MVSPPPGKQCLRQKTRPDGSSRRAGRGIKSRLERAEEVVRQWNDDRAAQVPPSPSAAASSPRPEKLGRYLSSVDDLILVAGSASLDAGLHARGKAALDAAMALLAEALGSLGVWETGKLGELYGQIVMTRQLGSRSRSSSLSSTANSRSTSGGGGGDSGAGASLEQSMLHKVLDRLDGDCFDLIEHGALAALCDVAGRMVQAGYAGKVRETVETMTSSLLRDLKPLRLCVLGGRSEVVTLKIWVSDTKFVLKVLETMQKQLNLQSCGAFDEFKHQYFLKLAEEPITQLLKSVAECSALGMPPQNLSSAFPSIIRALSAREELSRVIPTLQQLVPEERRVPVCHDAEDILGKLQDAVTGGVSELKRLIQTCHLEPTKDCSIHPVTQRTMTGLALLLHHHRSSWNAIPAVEPLDRLVPELVLSLEFTLEENCNQSLPEDLRYMFLTNNVRFIAQQVENSEMKQFFGDERVLKHQELVAAHMSSYLSTSWAPVLACLAMRKRTPFNLWNSSSLSSFTSAFESACSVQKAWKVPDPKLRQKLRCAIVEMVVPPYAAHLAKNARSGKSLRISAEDLKEQLMELFEG